MDLAAVQDRIAAAGLAFRGAFHPETADLPPSVSDGTAATTLVLVGFVGSSRWPAFAASQEARDDLPDPLDRWSRRIVGGMAGELGALACFPFEGPPWRPFQRWAQRCEPVHPSPIGTLIHPDWGLWHAYRGALGFAEALQLPPPDRRPSPCETCADKPCLTGCPVAAFGAGGFDAMACVGHISNPAGADCIDRGCRARLACPIGAEHHYSDQEHSFHLRAFLRAQHR